MNGLLRNYYYNALISMKQGINRNGEKNMAKPVLLLSIFEYIEREEIRENKIKYDQIVEGYNNFNEKLGWTLASVNYPFYFLTSDGFYHLKWKGEPIKTNNPTGKLIRENVEYAYLDDALWNLLQNVSVREEYREAIIRHYLK